MGDEQPTLFGGVEWFREDTRDYLTANPLPADFIWPHRDGGKRPVRPIYAVKGGYGKWLWETPYFPGLFELIHEELMRAPALGSADWLAEILNQVLSARESQRDLPLPRSH